MRTEPDIHLFFDHFLILLLLLKKKVYFGILKHEYTPNFLTVLSKYIALNEFEILEAQCIADAFIPVKWPLVQIHVFTVLVGRMWSFLSLSSQ